MGGNGEKKTEQLFNNMYLMAKVSVPCRRKKCKVFKNFLSFPSKEKVVQC